MYINNCIYLSYLKKIHIESALTSRFNLRTFIELKIVTKNIEIFLSTSYYHHPKNILVFFLFF